MLKKAFWSVLLLATLLVTFCAVNLSIYRPADFQKYQDLINKRIKLQSSNSLKTHDAHQVRKDVQKKVWIASENTRLHFRIHSAFSNLTISNPGDRIEMLENLKNIRCWIQDKIHMDEEHNICHQQIRYFTAKEGIYTFPSHQFNAKVINLAFFQIPGQKLPSHLEPKEAYLTGFAKEVSLFLSDREPHFKAHHFRASFNSEKELQ